MFFTPKKHKLLKTSEFKIIVEFFKSYKPSTSASEADLVNIVERKTGTTIPLKAFAEYIVRRLKVKKFKNQNVFNTQFNQIMNNITDNKDNVQNAIDIVINYMKTVIKTNT